MCANSTPAGDLFWQLRTGHDILITHRVPHHDTFSSTCAGTPWVVHEWLSFVAMWVAYKAGGFAGVFVLEAACASLLGLLLYFTILRETSGASVTSIVLTAFAVVVAGPYFQPRPQLVTYLGVTAVTWACLGIRRNHKRRLYGLLLLFALWSNLHAGVLAGIAVLCAFAVCDGIQYLIENRTCDNKSVQGPEGPEGTDSRQATTNEVTFDPKRIQHMLVISVLAVLLTMATPYTWHIYQDFWATISNKFAVDGVMEWQTPNYHAQFGKNVECFVGLILIALAASRRRIDIAEVVILVVLISESLTFGRNVPLLAFTGAPIIARHAQSSLQRAFFPGADTEFWQSDSLFGRNVGTVTVAAIGIALAVTTGIRIVDVMRSQDDAPTHGIQRLARLSFAVPSFPETAAAFVRRERMPGGLKLYNTYDDGGFLIWSLPQYPVFIDGRADVYFDKYLKLSVKMTGLPFDWERILDDHDCSLIICDANEAQARLFLGSPNWAAIYLDRPNLGDSPEGVANGIVLVKRSAVSAPDIARLRHDCKSMSLILPNVRSDFAALQ